MPDLSFRAAPRRNHDVNLTGFVIHSAIHAARPELHCVMQYGLAVSALEEGLVPLVQDAMPYFEQVAYHDYEGLSTNLDEQQRLARDLGDKQIMILRNHGMLTCGATVGEAFMLMYYLERSCKVHIQVMASGAEYRVLPADVCRSAAAQYALFPHGKYEWPALLRLLERGSPGFRE